MALIFEGADLVGKSTLADHFATTRNLPVVKIRWELREPEVETRAFAAATTEILRAVKPDVIFDRSYLSWWAYGPPLGYAVAYMPELVTRFDVVPGARLVLLTASSEELTQRFEQTPDLYFPLDVILRANQRFPSLLELLPPSLPYLHLDTTEVAVEEAIEKVERFISS